MRPPPPRWRRSGSRRRSARRSSPATPRPSPATTSCSTSSGSNHCSTCASGWAGRRAPCSRCRSSRPRGRSSGGWRRSRRPASTRVADHTASPLRRAADGFALATTFLTIAPVPVRAGAASRWTPAWFPVVGALVGALAGGVRYGLDPLLGPVPASVLAAATLVVCTGALHQDGLADLADGLSARGDRARRLAVMRDPRAGTFGVLAVGLWLLALVSALSGF